VRDEPMGSVSIRQEDWHLRHLDGLFLRELYASGA